MIAPKLTFRFIGYFLIFYFLLFLLSIGAFVFLFFEMMTGYPFADIRDTEILAIKSSIIETDGTYQFKDDLLHAAERSGGSLQIISNDGEVLSSFSGTGPLPQSYSLNELMELKHDEKYFMWPLDDDIYLLFIEQRVSDSLMDELLAMPSISSKDLQVRELLNSHDAWYVHLDKSGKRLSSFGDVPKNLSPSAIFLSQQNLTEQKESISTRSLSDGTTVVVGMDNPAYYPLDEEMMTFFKRMLIAFLVFNVAMIVLIVATSLWLGRRFGKPLIFILNWVERLGEGEYDIPENHKVMDTKTGKFKRKYRIYNDVLQSLTSLTYTLRDNKRFEERTERLREDWITGLTHDLKTPLSSIFGYSAMLNSDYDWSRDEIRQFAKTIKQKADYMDKLIQDLTLTYQLKENAVLLDFEKVELKDYLKNVCEENNWPIEYSANSDEIKVLLDKDRFERVLDNIITNAVKYNPDDVPIRLEVSTHESWAILRVMDEGTGMPQEVIDNLFTRYYRGTNTTEGDTGTGLGLTIAKQLVEAHKGEIQVLSSPAGTTVQIQLPILFKG